MNDMRDYFQKKSAELGLERGGQLVAIQAYLDELYPGECRAVSLNEGVLKITTPNASVASELRMGQQLLLAKLSAYDIQRIIISIR